MVTALITIYKPDSTVYSNLLTIVPQVDRVILCDNSPVSNEDKLPSGEKISYVFFGKNLALSGAFNRVLMDPGYQWGKDDYVIFFDQDSRIEEGHVAGLISEYELLSADYKVGCIGPVYHDRNLNMVRLPKIKIQISDSSYIVVNNITSSLLCRYGALQRISFWNEKIFLDMADWDLCWRLKESGYVCIRTKRVLFSHAVGDGEKKVGFIRLGISAPVRTYYQTRNYLLLLGKSMCRQGLKSPS